MVTQLQPTPAQAACVVATHHAGRVGGHARIGAVRHLGVHGHRLQRNEIAVGTDGCDQQAVAFAALALLGQRWAALLVGVEHHAIQTVQAFAVVDATRRVNGLRTATDRAGLAAVAVLFALQTKPTEGTGHGQ